MARTFAIITTCMGRLEHLRHSLPKMVAQAVREVIVVDYSCPQGTSDFVSKEFPSVRIVTVSGETHFSNWKARNAGAAAATSDVLIFVDADTILTDHAADQLSESLPEQAYGFFPIEASKASSRGGPRLAANQLKGFHVIPSEAFRRAGGYDEVLEGYAAGADTDLEERLLMIGVARHALEPAIIQSVIQHDAASRTERHGQPIGKSYAAGLLYRTAKRAVLRMQGTVELPLGARTQLYETAKKAAAALGSEGDRVTMNVKLALEPILMPRQLGYERGVQSLSLRVEVSLEGKLSEIPE